MEALKKKVINADKQRRVGFAMYYNEVNNRHDERLEMMKHYEGMLNNKEAPEQVPLHIEIELKELYEKTKKLCCCPICLELMIDKEEMCFSSCGHLYHPECYEKLLNMNDAKCALCRRKIYKKKN
jgi:choline kinase